MTEVSRAHDRPGGRSTPRAGALSDSLIWRGAAAAILGLAGLALVFVISPAALTLYGALIALVGVAQLLHPGRPAGPAQLWMQAGVALLYVVLGLGLMALPQAAAGLERLIAALFALSGLFRFIFALAWPRPIMLWGAGAGAGALAVGLVLLVVWPASALWFLGAAVALDLAVYGATSIGLGWALRA